jgi:hypothetical protein
MSNKVFLEKYKRLIDLWCLPNTNITNTLIKFKKFMKRDIGLKIKDIEYFIDSMGRNIGLPYHISSIEEIDNLMIQTKDILTSFGFNKRNQPFITTIAKSETDHHTPRKHVKILKKKLLKVLKNIFK